MKRLLTPAFLSVFLLMSLVSLCHAGVTEPVSLELKFKIEEGKRFNLTQRMEMSQSMFGMTSTMMTTTKNTQLLEKIEHRNDGRLIIQSTNEAVEFKISSDGAVVAEYDSRNPDHQALVNDPNIAPVAGTVGMQVQLLLDKSGTVHDIPNIKDLQDFVAAQKDPSVRMMLTGMFEKEALIAMNEMNYKLLPEAPVEVGDEWTKHFDTPFPFGTLVIEFRLKLDKIRENADGQYADLTMLGSMRIEGAVDGQVAMQIVDPVVTGKYVFNNTIGFFESMDLDLDYTMVTEGDEDVAVRVVQGITWKQVE